MYKIPVTVNYNERTGRITISAAKRTIANFDGSRDHVIEIARSANLIDVPISLELCTRKAVLESQNMGTGNIYQVPELLIKKGDVAVNVTATIAGKSVASNTVFIPTDRAPFCVE